MAVLCFFDKSHEDNIAHFQRSFYYASQVVKIANNINSFEQGNPNEIVELMEKALAEAKLVDIDELNEVYDGFGTHYRDEYIKGIKICIEGCKEVDLKKLMKSQLLLSVWQDWYLENIEKAFEADSRYVGLNEMKPNNYNELQ